MAKIHCYLMLLEGAKVTQQPGDCA